MKKLFMLLAGLLAIVTSCNTSTASGNHNDKKETAAKVSSKHEALPAKITIEGIAQNPEGIEYDKNDQTFLLSSLNAGPVIKVNVNGSYKPFTHGEPYPMSTAGLQIDYPNNRLLVAAFNGMELYDQDPETKGTANLRIYNLTTGAMEKDINLSALVPDAPAYFANDVAVDTEGNVYISDWFAGVVYKVDMAGNPSIFWRNETGIPSGANGLDYHPDGYLLVSLVSVNEKGLYANYGLIKVPVSNPKLASVVNITNSGFAGFDGMVVTADGNVIGVTNNGKTPGGNTLIEISGSNDWQSATVMNASEIAPSTTVAVTPEGLHYVINQDFTRNEATTWVIEQIRF